MTSHISSRKRPTPDTPLSPETEVQRTQKLAEHVVSLLSKNLPGLKENEEGKKNNWINLFTINADNPERISLTSLAFRLIYIIDSSNEEVSLATHYLCKKKIAKANTIHNLFALSLLASVKFLRDGRFANMNKIFAKEIEVSSKQIGEMEMAFFFNYLNLSAFPNEPNYSKIHKQITDSQLHEKSDVYR